MADFTVPAVCNHCGFIFGSALVLRFGGSAKLSGMTSRCPRCGATAAIPDQSIKVLEQGIRVFQAEDFTLEVLKALNIAVEDLRAKTKPTPIIIAELRSTSPSLAKEFREWANLGLGFVVAMAAVATAVFAWSQTPGQNRTVDEVAVDSFESVYQQPQPVVRQRLRFRGVEPYDPDNYPHKKNRKIRRAETAKDRRNRR